MRAIIFANGHLANPTAYRSILRPDDWLIAADGGAAHARAVGVTPHTVIGDADSLEPGLRAELEAAGAQFVTHPVDKEETDLELALLYAVQHGATEIILLAALGGRLDQTLANLYLLAHPALVGIHVQIMDEKQTAFLIRNQAFIPGQVGDTVSLLPLAGDAHGVSAKGFRWPLNDETLQFSYSRGISNVLSDAQARVSVREGMILCIILHQDQNHCEEER